MPTPEDLQYGWDLSCTDDLDPTLTEITGRMVLAEWVIRLLQSDGLFYSPDHGVDLRRLVSGVTDDRQRARLADRIKTTLVRDDRVAAAEVGVTFDAPTETMRVTLAIATAEGPFRMVLAISSATVEVLNTQGL